MGGISATTPNNVAYGNDGYITVNTVDIGATVGDFTVEWGATHYYPNFTQALGPLSGSGTVTDAMFRLQCSIAEWAWANLSAAIGTLGSDSSGNSYKIGGQAISGPVELTSVVLTGISTNGGKAMKVTLGKAYVEVGNPVFSKTQEAVLPLTFVGLFTGAAPTTLPGYIEIQK